MYVIFPGTGRLAKAMRRHEFVQSIGIDHKVVNDASVVVCALI